MAKLYIGKIPPKKGKAERNRFQILISADYYMVIIYKTLEQLGLLFKKK